MLASLDRHILLKSLKFATIPPPLPSISFIVQLPIDLNLDGLSNLGLVHFFHLISLRLRSESTFMMFVHMPSPLHFKPVVSKQ